MLLVIELVVVVAVLLLVALAAAGRAGGLAQPPADMVEPGLPAGTVRPEDVRAVRFGLAFRGYRMREVDEVLDALAATLAERDAVIARLRAAQEPAEPEDRDPVALAPVSVPVEPGEPDTPVPTESTPAGDLHG